MISNTNHPVCVFWSRSIRSGSIFTISPILNSSIADRFIFTEYLDLHTILKFKYFLFVDQFTEDFFRNQKILSLLAVISQLGGVSHYLDGSDSAELKYYKYSPFFTKWFKKQIYSDLELYRKSFIGGRVYSDYYAKKYSLTTDEGSVAVDPGVSLDKLRLYWNVLVGPYPITSFKFRLMRYGIKFFGVTFLKYFFFKVGDLPSSIPIVNKRGISARFTGFKNYSNSVGYQRKLVSSVLDAFRLIPQGSISQSRYNTEVSSSLAVISPFGWGEICHRDAEAFANGALLVKANMCHIRTEPDLYLDGKTYVSFAWDCSDLEAIISAIIDNPMKFGSIAAHGEALIRAANKSFDLYVRRLYNEIVGTG